MTNQRDMKCKKKKVFYFSFSNRNLKATKEQILFIYFFKNNDVQCIKDKTIIYMHIKQVYVLFIFLFINAKEKTAYQLMQASNVSKANRQLL